MLPKHVSKTFEGEEKKVLHGVLNFWWISELEESFIPANVETNTYSSDILTIFFVFSLFFIYTIRCIILRLVSRKKTHLDSEGSFLKTFLRIYWDLHQSKK